MKFVSAYYFSFILCYTITCYYAFLSIPMLKVHYEKQLLYTLNKRLQLTRELFKKNNHFKLNKVRRRITKISILQQEQKLQHIIILKLNMKNNTLRLSYLATFKSTLALLQRILDQPNECKTLTLSNRSKRNLVLTELECNIKNE